MVADMKQTFLGVGYTRDRAGLPLEAVRVPVPRPAADEVLIRVAASSLNPLEYKLADLNFMGRTPPVVLGFDLAGVVADVGRDVEGVAVGDEVAAMADLNGDGCRPHRRSRTGTAKHQGTHGRPGTDVRQSRTSVAGRQVRPGRHVRPAQTQRLDDRRVGGRPQPRCHPAAVEPRQLGHLGRDERHPPLRHRPSGRRRPAGQPDRRRSG
jgi:hypothetical protein